MPRITPADPATIDAATKASLEAVRKKLGMVPNLFATFARAPSVLAGYLAFSDALGNGALTAKQRAIVALAVAQANGCHYCLSAHTMMAKGAGLSPEGVRAAREGSAHDTADNAVGTFARRVVEQRGHVTDADLATARASGLGDALIVEVVANVAINAMTNFTNNVAQTDIDFPEVEVALPKAA